MSDERLQILGVAGRGKGSVVYRGYDFDRAKTVAVKVAYRPTASFRRMLELEHPSIAAVHDFQFDVARGVERTIRDYVEGASLETLLRNLRPLGVREREMLTGRELLSFVGHSAGVSSRVENSFESLSFPEAVALMGYQLTMALSAAHEKGFIHQNLKPSNVIIGLSGTASLVDFNTPQGLFPSVMGIYEKADRFSLISLLWDLVDGRVLRSESLNQLTRSEPPESLSAKLLRFLQPDYFRHGTGVELRDTLWEYLASHCGSSHTQAAAL